MACLIAAIVITLSVIEGHSSVTTFILCLCTIWQDIDWQSKLCSPSAITRVSYLLLTERITGINESENIITFAVLKFGGKTCLW